MNDTVVFHYNRAAKVVEIEHLVGRILFRGEWYDESEFRFLFPSVEIDEYEPWQLVTDVQVLDRYQAKDFKSLDNEMDLKYNTRIK